MCLPEVVDRLAGKQRLVGMYELAGDLVAVGVACEDAIALVLDRVTAGDDVDQQAAVRQTVERRGHARRHRRRLQPRPHCDQELQPLGGGRHRRGDNPGILAALARWQKHAVVAELVGSLSDLAQIREVSGTASYCGAEVPAVSMSRQEPQHVYAVARKLGGDIHDCGFFTASAIEMAAGIRPSLKNTSAIFCCAATTSGVIGFTP